MSTYFILIDHGNRSVGEKPVNSGLAFINHMGTVTKTMIYGGESEPILNINENISVDTSISSL